jgi:hypothetical protein
MLGRPRNIKATSSQEDTAGFDASVCSLARTTTRGSIQISAASLPAAAAASRAAYTSVGITSVVVRYIEKGSGLSMVIADGGSKGSRTVIRSSNSSLAATTAGVWSPKAAVVPFASLASSIIIELYSMSPYPKNAALQLISVEVTTAVFPNGTHPTALLKQSNNNNNHSL